MEKSKKDSKGGVWGMILPRPQDAVHKMQLLRLLSRILDDDILSHNIYFKGGTCAAMLGYLDRFSLDLDFDLKDRISKNIVDKNIQVLFRNLGLTIKQKSRKELFYVVKYEVKNLERNSIKVSVIPKTTRSNQYATVYLPEIDRYAACQTKETMVSHKLVSLTDRYKKYRTIAGRDLYDIHHFLSHGYRYIPQIIKDRTKKLPLQYFRELVEFIEVKITDRIITEDLNYLILSEKFQRIRKTLKKETILLLKDEITRIAKG